MLINAKVAKAINEHIPREGNASNIYKAMQLWCNNKGYPNSAKFFEEASKDETNHRNMMLEFLSDMGADPEVPASLSHKFKGECLCDCFMQALDLEIKVSNYIHDIQNTIMDQKDWHSFSFWQFFIEEQETSVREFTDLVGRVKAAGENPLDFDEQLGD